MDKKIQDMSISNKMQTDSVQAEAIGITNPKKTMQNH